MWMPPPSLSKVKYLFKFNILDSVPNFGNKIGDNNVILTDKSGEEIKTLYPINSTPEMLFRTIFNKNSQNVLNTMNFLAKNYRPQCDLCSNLCGLDWYIHISNRSQESSKIQVILTHY